MKPPPPSPMTDVMHGDDAGSSARVVWVVHPTLVANTDAAGGGGGGDKVDQLPLAKVKAVEERRVLLGLWVYAKVW